MASTHDYYECAFVIVSFRAKLLMPMTESLGDARGDLAWHVNIGEVIWRCTLS